MIQTNLNEGDSSNMGGRCVVIATGLYVPRTTMEICPVNYSCNVLHTQLHPLQSSL